MSDNEKRLAEIKARTSAATPGPWTSGKFGLVKGGPVQQFARGSGQQQLVAVSSQDWMRDGEVQANTDFIAHAREDVPFLLEQLELAQHRLQGAHDSLREHMLMVKAEKDARESALSLLGEVSDELKEAQGQRDQACAVVGEFQAEAERLRKEAVEIATGFPEELIRLRREVLDLRLVAINAGDPTKNILGGFVSEEECARRCREVAQEFRKAAVHLHASDTDSILTVIVDRVAKGKS